MQPTDQPEHSLTGSRFIERLGLLWAVVFSVSLAVSAFGAFVESPVPLRGGRAAAALALIVLSTVLFQRYYWHVFSFVDGWPMRRRKALLYFGGQLLLLALLLGLDQSFVGFGFALMGQTFGVLRPRFWALVLLPLFALMAPALGLIQEQANWSSLLTIAVLVGVSVLIAILIARLFQQRYELLDIVAELRGAKALIARQAAEAEELAALRERTRLAREMHDSIGHALVLVSVKLEAAQRLYARDLARGDAELEATRALVRATMTDLRRSLADLRAPLLHHDLLAALACEAHELQAYGLHVALELPPALPPLPPEVAEGLWRVAREALTNVGRHAAASHASVTLELRDDELLLRVCDNGVGIQAERLGARGHYGIVGMRERVAALGGSFRVRAQPQGGTLVEARVPSMAHVEGPIREDERD
jgi:signal transduction histidine kinase